MSLSIKSWWVSTPSSYAVLSIISKSRESANICRNIPPITQNLNTITFMIKIIVILIFILHYLGKMLF